LKDRQTMKEVHSYKANKHYSGEKEIESVIIILDQEIPEIKGATDLIPWEQQALNEAEKIEQILLDTLPGGVYDRVMARMCARKASLYKVPLLS